ncbi:MAG: hypothetical protein JWR24_3843 [Actinoallomurus sp.]|nr:hypothetical protein [Actinoallomurus sp.]
MAVRDVDPHHLEKYLLPQEEQTVTIRRHPAMLLRYIGETLAGLIVAGLLTAVVSQSTVLTVIWCAWLAVVGRFAFKVFEWSDEFFAVTKVRVILVTGVFTRRVDMMPLTKVTDLTVNRSIMGRMFGYGTIVLESAGQDQALSKVEHVPEPEAIYLEISAVAFGSGDD